MDALASAKVASHAGEGRAGTPSERGKIVRRAVEG